MRVVNHVVGVGKGIVNRRHHGNQRQSEAAVITYYGDHLKVTAYGFNMGNPVLAPPKTALDPLKEDHAAD